VFVVTEPDFKEWKQNHVTVAVMKALFNDRELLKEMLLAGTENDDEIRGRAAATRLILTMTYEDLMESLKERVDE
jgi:hypothetical protein